MRAVLQFLTGYGAGHRQPASSGPLPLADPRDPAPARVRLELGPRGWRVTSADSKVMLRVNGRSMAEGLIQDRDIIGCGRSLYRIYLADSGPAASAPRRTLTLDSATPPSVRQAGLSTVVTAPGRWGDVAATWYNDVVLRLEGRSDGHPDELVARLGRRVNCHALVDASDHEVAGSELPGSVRLVPLLQPEGDDAALIRRLWSNNSFVGLLSPLERDVLMAALRPLATLLAYPAAVRPLLCRPDKALVDGLQAADAGVLFGGPKGWELFCCPEIRALWRRLGLPEKDDASEWRYRVTECAEGLSRLDGSDASPRPAEVAAALATRGCLHLLIDGDLADVIPASIPRTLVPGGRRGSSLLIGPDAGIARLELIETYWGRGAILGLVSSRNVREVERLVARLPLRSDGLEDQPFAGAGHNRLAGFDALLFDPADGGWAVFTDARPRPIWQQYGLPTPMLGGAA